MILAVDIGNTNVTCGVYDGEKWVHILRLPSTLNFWNQFSTLKEFDITECAISSVVPNLMQVYIESIRNLFQIDAHIITCQNSGVELLVETPQDVGIDRICNVAAAKLLVGTPAIVGDIGSATNYDVVDKNGAFIGGAISPGLETAANNLFNKAALLKSTAFMIPPSSIGKNTQTNLQSGIMFGAIDVIDGMFRRLEIDLGYKGINKIITGGFGKLISPHLKTKHQLIPNLTLDGIRLIFKNSI